MKQKVPIILISILLTGSALPVFAFYSNSSNFTVRQKIQSISGQSSSTNFKSVAAGGQLANFISTATSFKDYAGILKIIYNGIKPTYDLTDYHWRNDDGTETTATSATGGTANTSYTLAELTTKRLRIEISNEGGTRVGYAAQQFRLEYGLLSTTCAAIGTWTDVGAVGGDFDMADSTNLTDGNNTTNIAVANGGVADANNTFISSNAAIKDTSSQVASLSVPSNSFVEIEYSIQALVAATDGGTYCFRVTDAGSATNFTYTRYAQAVIGQDPELTMSISANTINLGLLTTASVSSQNHTVTITTNASSGYSLYISDDGNLRNGSNDIDDVSDGTVTAGSEEYGLNTGFNDFSSDAAITTSLKTARSNGSAVTNQSTTCTYKASISSATVNGSYSHTVTYIVVGNF